MNFRYLEETDCDPIIRVIYDRLKDLGGYLELVFKTTLRPACVWPRSERRRWKMESLDSVKFEVPQQLGNASRQEVQIRPPSESTGRSEDV